MSVPTITLNNGVTMPQLGFGVYQIPAEATAEAVTTALEAGYRAIDTATLYRNEEAVGRAISASGIPREDVFVTTKLWNSDQGYDNARRAFDTSLRNLGLDRLDLYLIHWPLPSRDLFGETWRALEKIYADGLVRAIGVSNFAPHHLRRLAETATITPAVNQVELHPYLQQRDTRAYDGEHAIATEAWAPLAKGGKLLSDPVIDALARKHDRTPAQVVLRWHIQHGTIVIPKSQTPSRVRENFDIFGFALDEGDMAEIDGLDEGTRTGPDPDGM
ncbi:MAG TPA: aldo/keto reductase [Streptosporangiaceae bacterium]|jgi:diketogulonate reductase-like aldo/keto reductase